MKHTNAKSSQSGTSANPTTLNLQTRPFAPIQADSDQNDKVTDGVSVQARVASSENILARLIATPKTEPLATPIRRKVFPSMRMPIQAKLNIGEPDDKYEKEADNTAAKVVQQINASPQDNSVQKQEGAEEELQRSSISKIQRMEEEKELQMKSLVQRQENIGGGAASEDLESSIQSARGSGQSLEPNLQAKMGQVMGADFSSVKVHTDSQSDQLNKSIQAKAFTTGQDVFFRQGAYDPSSQGGQELIAHELTHVVQQNGSSIQRKLFQSSALLKPITHTQAISIQAAPDQDAYVNDVAQLHEVDPLGKDKGTVKGGKKLKVGSQIKVDPSSVLGEWTETEGGKYIRTTKFTLKSMIDGSVPDTSPSDESNTVEIGEETTDQFGGGFDGIAGGIELNSLKTNQGGMLVDIDGSENTKAFDSKSGLDIVSGSGDALTGLFGIVANARQIMSSENKVSWDNLISGIGFVQSIAKSTSGATKIVDAISKASGSKTGVGQSDVASKITGAIADSLGAVKDSAMGVIGIYRLFKSQSDQKGKDAAVTFKAFASAAGSAAKVAKGAYDIIGNGIPMSIINVVPALSIAVSAINVLIRLYDAFTAGNSKEDMMQTSAGKLSTLAPALGEATPNTDNINSSAVFDKDRRGTFPNYKTYFRTKQTVRKAVKDIAGAAQTKSTTLEKEHNDWTLALSSSYVGPKTQEEESKPITDSINLIKNKINTDAPDPVKTKLNQLIGGKDPKTATEFIEQIVKPLNKLDVDVDEYELADKMSEINQKRQTSGWTDVILELVSMAGDITTIAVGATGIGAAIGQGVKAASAGYKVVHGGSKFVQKLYRDRNTDPGQEDNKSSKKKNEEYANHAKFIFMQIASLAPGDTDREEQLQKYVRATGVNYGLWEAQKSQPAKQVEMLVEAMKQRA